jgi:hypothetical protein
MLHAAIDGGLTLVLPAAAAILPHGPASTEVDVPAGFGVAVVLSAPGRSARRTASRCDNHGNTLVVPASCGDLARRGRCSIAVMPAG